MASESDNDDLNDFCFPKEWCFGHIEKEGLNKDAVVTYSFYCAVSTNDSEEEGASSILAQISLIPLTFAFL